MLIDLDDGIIDMLGSKADSDSYQSHIRLSVAPDENYNSYFLVGL
jgi:hypothetical protein